MMRSRTSGKILGGHNGKGHSLPPTPHVPHASTVYRCLTYIVFVPLFALSTAGFGLLSLLASLWDRSGRQQHALARLWASTLLRISFSPVEIIGAENHPQGPAVYAANHLSYMDTPALFASLPFQFRILAKHSLWKIPFIGWHLQRSGQVPVDQSSARSSIASLGRGVHALLHSGLPLVLFPEGGRTPDGTLQPMLSGAAYMALRAQVPLVPVTLVGTRELLPMHTYHLTPRPLKLILSTPIPTVGLTTRDADRLTQQLLKTIQSTYAAHHASSF